MESYVHIVKLCCLLVGRSISASLWSPSDGKLGVFLSILNFFRMPGNAFLCFYRSFTCRRPPRKRATVTVGRAGGHGSTW